MIAPLSISCVGRRGGRGSGDIEKRGEGSREGEGRWGREREREREWMFNDL